MSKRNAFIIPAFLLVVQIAAHAQSGGPFTVTQSVISNGGTSSATGGQFTVAGTNGQPIAGQPASASPFDVFAGFWNYTSPAIPVFMAGGRITNDNGQGVRNVLVTMISSAGTQTVLSSSFGFFRFDNIPSGDTIILSVKSKRYRFSPSILTITLTNTRDDINFTAQE